MFKFTDRDKKLGINAQHVGLLYDIRQSSQAY